MARRKIDPAILAHVEWLNFVRPMGLVVSAPALVRAGAILDRRDAEGQRILRDLVVERDVPGSRDTIAAIPDFLEFAKRFLHWSFLPVAYAGTSERPMLDELETSSSEGSLRPDFAVRELDAKDGVAEWQLLVSVYPEGTDLDASTGGAGVLDLSPHGRMERLLRKTRVPAGLLFNGTSLRLISAPQRESSGWIDFQVAQMVQTAGRPIATALRLLLSEPRLLSLPRQERLATLLEDSRKFQNEVSERLSEQVLHALYEMLRGFQSASDATKGALLDEQLREYPDEIYRGLLSVILRLVFLLYAEERNMLPDSDTWLRYYSLAGLYDRLREDASLYPDTMDQRFGAWAQLLTLFRMVHDGATAGDVHLPQRYGALFDPDRYTFLEGRPLGSTRRTHAGIESPLVPDGTVYRVLEQLLILDGERISYRALDVEQIGSVYETMMGFRLELATGQSVAIRAGKKGGAPASVSLDALLDETPGKRDQWLLEHTSRKLTDTMKQAVAAAVSIEDLHAALLSAIDLNASPDLTRKGTMVLQPSEERRSSGSHYTPRAFTEPIVRKTLEPILLRLHGDGGRLPKPEQILDLKVCDPAMGSGAFLVEACRQLGAALVESWHAHDVVPSIPADEREDLYAMRLVAQRCLYGVDRNPVAVDLAKMSLWLVTLAKDHPLTFLDHALRHGDSLVGLSRKQIEAFHWDASKPPYLHGLGIRDSLDTVIELRRQIREAGEDVADQELRERWNQAQNELSHVRFVGDLVISAFFDAEKPKEREAKRLEYLNAIVTSETDSKQAWIEERRTGNQPLVPFHWEIEFPEVFERTNPGFEAMLGNPPFLNGTRISTRLGESYRDWLLDNYSSTNAKADLVAFFFRRAFDLLRADASLGMIATITIAMGDTRAAALERIVASGGVIYNVIKRIPWPGQAAVTVSALHIAKGHLPVNPHLDGRTVDRISAFLFHTGPDTSGSPLLENRGICFSGPYVMGAGFLFDDSDADATPHARMHELLAANPVLADVIWPYIGGDDFLSDPEQRPSRHVIYLGEADYDEAREKWPELMQLLEEKVKPDRSKKDAKKYPRMVNEWWKFWNARHELMAMLPSKQRVLMTPFTSTYVCFGFVSSRTIIGTPHVAVCVETYAGLASLQSRVHEVWVRFLGSTMEDRQRYTPSDCFETFPFPANWERHPGLEAAGKAYYEFRANLMVQNNEGLTKTYNRFHNPNETDSAIVKLRELHAAMDRAMLDAYGWTDISTHCEFLLDYEIDEEEWGTKKRPYRLRWPDDVRDEVLARLLELNASRAAEEARAGGTNAKKSGRKSSRKAKSDSVLSFDL